MNTRQEATARRRLAALGFKDLVFGQETPSGEVPYSRKDGLPLYDPPILRITPSGVTLMSWDGSPEGA